MHAVAYSLLLLNTDLHVAEISSHMSRTQFVRNTMSAVMPERKQSIDLATAHMLEKNLAQRPDKKDLIDRNILKGACSLFRFRLR